MSASIVCADYYHAMVKDRPGAAYELLSQLAEKGVGLMAFNAIPMGADCTQLVLFPRSPSRLAKAAEDAGIDLTDSSTRSSSAETTNSALSRKPTASSTTQISTSSPQGVWSPTAAVSPTSCMSKMGFRHAARVLDAG